ncbi:MAG: GNAT family N-acetyltransferase [Candidatus Cybelea sp.]
MYRLRTAIQADAKVIADWFPTHESAVSWGGPDVPTNFVATWLANQYAGSSGRHFVLVDESGWICGTCAVRSLENPRRMHVSQLAVAPTMRGRGLGRRLLDLVVILARSAGAGKLTLFVYEGNAPARRLYERYGFVISANERAKASPYGAMLPMELDLTSADKATPADSGTSACRAGNDPSIPHKSPSRHRPKGRK